MESIPSQKQKLAYIAGFFDGEGCVSIYYKGRTISRRLWIDNTDQEVIEKIKMWLYESNIQTFYRVDKSTNPRTGLLAKPLYRLMISDRKNMTKFAKIIPLQNINKKNKLKELLNSYSKVSPQAIRLKYLKKISKEKLQFLYWHEEFSAKEIAKIFKTSDSVILRLMKYYSISTRKAFGKEYRELQAKKLKSRWEKIKNAGFKTQKEYYYFCV